MNWYVLCPYIEFILSCLAQNISISIIASFLFLWVLDNHCCLWCIVKISLIKCLTKRIIRYESKVHLTLICYFFIVFNWWKWSWSARKRILWLYVRSISNFHRLIIKVHWPQRLKILRVQHLGKFQMHFACFVEFCVTYLTIN